MGKKVAIVGAGEVGINLVKALNKEDYEIIVIDVNTHKCKRINEKFDVSVIEGDGASQRVLQQIDMESIDFFFALTRIDEVNLVASRMAKKMGANKIISRLRNTEYNHKDAVITPEQFGIDFVAYPEKAAQREIELLIRESSTTEIEEFKDGKITLAGITLSSTSPLLGRTLEKVVEANPYIPHKVVVILRNDNSFIPYKDVKYQINDTIFFLCKSENVKKVQQMAGKPAIDVNSIMILGAGKIGRLLAKSLQNDYNIRLVEKNVGKAWSIKEKLKDILVLTEDGTNIEFLESENVGDLDCFIAATEDEQTNIVSGLLARHLGVKQVIVHISTTDYLQAIRHIGFDAVLSKNIAAVNEVVKFMKSDMIKFISRFEDLDTDCMEIRVKEDSKYIKKRYTIEKIPPNIVLGAILRNDKIEIPNHNSQIYPDDELLLFTKPDFLITAERLFR
ncbi:MAG: Trk system potassium transporter TrkA [Candidatus Marinimicrobia bacterium]|nr:Trk system potassium transporter TrkA [Candidatus Neomarinimicrobiota bacterium]|tara:strand:- start:703 stop:2049 length:1347 start_codon:yes stop_codon:yes gene_type:complete